MSIAQRIARGLRYEVERAHRGRIATYTRFAKRVGLRTAADVIALMNPLRKRPPKLGVRKAIERETKDWPGGALKLGAWR